jgi:tRNA pseudouridine65 synthase
MISETPPFRILYQDENLIAIDKPAGFLVHPVNSPEEQKWIVMKRLRDQIGQRVFPSHRLDRPTSGVLLFALDSKTASLTQQAFARREVQKTYLSVIEGNPPDRWTCEQPIVENEDRAPLEAITFFKLLLHRQNPEFPETLKLSLVEARPETGRFHQIRRHLASDGFPIVGDYRYAGIERSDELGKILGTGTRMLLQSRTLQLRHPHTGEPLQIEAPIDPDFLRCFPDLLDQ